MCVRKVNNNNVVVVHVILFNFNVRHCRVRNTNDDDGGAQSAGVSGAQIGRSTAHIICFIVFLRLLR